MKRTQEADDELKPALDVFKKEHLVRYNMACYACVLGNKDEARELLDKAIKLGGDAGIMTSGADEANPKELLPSLHHRTVARLLFAVAHRMS